MFDDFFKERKRYFSKKSAKEAGNIVEGLKNELDEHRDAINENAAEIQESYSCMNEINNKLDKLSERLERMEVFLQGKANFVVEEQSFAVQPLTKSEQQVFLVIYALEDEKGLVSSAEIAKKTGLPHYLVTDYVGRLVEKGVPIMRKYVNNQPFLKLNPEFKRLQAIENVLEIDTAQKELVQF